MSPERPIGTLLTCGRLDEARSLADAYEDFDDEEMSDAERNILHDVLAECHARCGRWDEAVAHWQKMVLGEPLGENAIRGLVQIAAAKALLTAQGGIDAIKECRKHRSIETELMLPGNEERILAELEKELRGFISSLEAVVPEERRKDFGIQGD